MACSCRACGASIRPEVCRLGVAVWRRFWCDAIAYDGLSALTQLTRLATGYRGNTQRETLYGQLAQLTGLLELDAPQALDTDGGKQCHSHFSIRLCILAKILQPGRVARVLDHSRASAMQLSRGACQLMYVSSGVQDQLGSITGGHPAMLRCACAGVSALTTLSRLTRLALRSDSGFGIEELAMKVSALPPKPRPQLPSAHWQAHSLPRLVTNRAQAAFWP